MMETVTRLDLYNAHQEFMLGETYGFDGPSCLICGDLDKRWRGFVGGAQLASNMVNTAQAGCEPCGLILRGIRKLYPGWGSSKEESGYEGQFAIHYEPGKPLSLLICLLKKIPVDDMGDVIAQFYVDFYTLEDEISEFSMIGPGTPVPERMLDCTKYVPQWLQTCINTHSNCRTPINPENAVLDYQRSGAWTTDLPARVIDLGCETNNWHICLRISSPGDKGPYVCLSYTWGDEQPLRTTTANIKDHMAGIAFDDLPNLFRFVLFVTKNLGIRYIWIDSLCIIQDDRQDWERESACMDRIYGNSILTLAATFSLNATNGIVPLNQERYKSHPVRDVDSNHTAQIYVRNSLHYDENEEKSTPPLRRRGWTFQEYFLSSRILRFDYGEFVWECESERRCVCGSTALLPGLSDRTSFLNLVRSIGNSGLDIATYDYQGIWQNVVQLYSNRSLTVQADKLPALSGIARKFQAVCKWHYMAGLWLEDICSGLLWYCEGDTFHRKVESYRAPSWSWASVDGAVKYHRPIKMETFDSNFTLILGKVGGFRIKVIGASCTPCTIDPTGAVKGGYLRISGSLISVTYLGKLKGNYSCEKDGKSGHFFADFSITNNHITTIPKPNDTLFVLLLAFYASASSLSSRDPPSRFLALILRNTNSTTLSFERLGLMLYMDDDLNSWFEGASEGEITIV